MAGKVIFRFDKNRVYTLKRWPRLVGSRTIHVAKQPPVNNVLVYKKKKNWKQSSIHAGATRRVLCNGTSWVEEQLRRLFLSLYSGCTVIWSSLLGEPAARRRVHSSSEITHAQMIRNTKRTVRGRAGRRTCWGLLRLDKKWIERERETGIFEPICLKKQSGRRGDYFL